MDILPLAALTLLTAKLVDFCKDLIPVNITAKAIIPISMAVGIILVLLAGLSPAIAPYISLFDGVTLAQADLAAQLIYGCVLGATAGVLHDLRKGGNNG